MKPAKVLKSPLLSTADREGQESPLVKTLVRVAGFPLLAAVPTKLAACAGGHRSTQPVLSASHRPWRRALFLAPDCRLHRNVNSTYGNRDGIIFIIAANSA